MSENWVVNASPLIVLAKIDHLFLLPQLTKQLAIPQEVVTEIQNGPIDDPARHFLEASPLPVVSTPANPLVLSWDLGSGETGRF